MEILQNDHGPLDIPEGKLEDDNTIKYNENPFHEDGPIVNQLEVDWKSG